MSDTPAPVPIPDSKPEDVRRGTLFSLGSILIAVVLFAIVGWVGVGLYGVILAGIGMPFVAAWLYRIGSGGQLTRAGWVPFILISLVAVIVGVITGVVSAVARQFGGGAQMWNALWLNLTNLTPGGQGFFAILGVLLGGVGIVLALRQRTPAQQIASRTQQWSPPGAALPGDQAPPPPPGLAEPTATEATGTEPPAGAGDADSTDGTTGTPPAPKA